jgi:4-hydroxybenzoate polyprenyltransferase
MKPSLRAVVSTLVDYGLLIRLHRPVGTWLLLWPALWALWMSSAGHPNEHVFVVFCIGVFLTRSAGCAINDWADRKVDPEVKRTRDRPLAAGRIQPSEALIVYAILCLLAFALVLTLDRVTIACSVVGAGLMAAYPFMKRFFPLPQAWLGLAFSWSIPMAWVAQQGGVTRIGWLVFVAGTLWVMVYDTQYAMVDRDDDLRLGVHSSAITFGDADRVVLGALQSLTLLALLLAGQSLGLGRWYHVGLGVGALTFIYQQWLIRDRSRDGCFAAFINNQWFGLAVFLGIALDYFFKAH